MPLFLILPPKFSYPAKRALKDVCDFWDKIGRERIEEYVLSLSAHCKQRIREVFGDKGTLFSPDIPELSSALTAFNPFDDPTDSTNIVTFRDRLRDEYGFIIRYTNFKIKLDDLKDSYALRISTHLFHNHQQVENLVDAMYDLYLDMIYITVKEKEFWHRESDSDFTPEGFGFTQMLK